MKIFIFLQRVLALVAILIGLILTVSEVPMSEGLSSQAWLTVGGICIVIVAMGWEWLINQEERRFIHETRA